MQSLLTARGWHEPSGRAATEDAVVVWRSFAEPRNGMTTNRAADDRSLLWGVVDVRSVQTVQDAF